MFTVSSLRNPQKNVGIGYDKKLVGHTEKETEGHRLRNVNDSL